MKSERYTVKQFNQQFPDDAACLDYIWTQRYPEGLTCKCGVKDGFHRVATRKCYSCQNCGHQVSPCEGTIFHKSSTSLKTWFHAMFLMTASKNGVSAKELERQTGVTYKTAWRMAHQIRKLMTQGTEMLGGLNAPQVEVDETYVGGVGGQEGKIKDKTCVFGMLERGGDVRVKVVPNAKLRTLVPHIQKTVKQFSAIYSDEAGAYSSLRRNRYFHETVQHSEREYVRAMVHTNSIEGFWSQLKRSINGTFHQVSRDYLQAYVDEFAFRYNRRASVTEAPIFPMLVERVGQQRA